MRLEAKYHTMNLKQLDPFKIQKLDLHVCDNDNKALF